MARKGRVPTGIYGLDDLLSKGFRENTVNLVRGGTGVGKTTFALQYSLYGLNHGEKAIYISFEMSEEQIIRDCRDLGWKEIENYLKDGSLRIVHLFGEDLTFPSLDIAEIVRKLMPANNPRIAIDPLTYPTFFTDKEKRKSLSTIFQEMRKLGTALIILEEPINGTVSHGISAMPLYLADTVIHLQNLGYGEMYDRTLRIMKHRGSKHGEGLYPYSIEDGLGIVLHASEEQLERTRPKTKFDDRFKEALEKTKAMGSSGEILAVRIEALRENWTRDDDPSPILKLVFKEETRSYAKRT
ncbi:MAG TPA: ATPase domain-containing protein [Candidatus Methanoperedens sp.]